MARDPVVYIEDILQAAARARLFVEGFSMEAFAADLKTQYAIVRALEVIGEAAKRVPVDVQDKVPEIEEPLRRLLQQLKISGEEE